MLNTFLKHVKHIFNETHVLQIYFTHVFNIFIKHVLNIGVSLHMFHSC